MFYAANRAVRAAIGVSAIALAVASAPTVQAQKAAPQSSTGLTPNYELAAAWTTQRVSRLDRRTEDLPYAGVQTARRSATGRVLKT